MLKGVHMDVGGMRVISVFYIFIIVILLLIEMNVNIFYAPSCPVTSLDWKKKKELEKKEILK